MSDKLPEKIQATYSLVEKCWNRARKRKKKGAEDIFASVNFRLSRKGKPVMGEDLLLLGLPVEVTLECLGPLVKDPKVEDGYDKVVAAAFLVEHWKVESDKESAVLEKTDEGIVLKEQFVTGLTEAATQKGTADYWRKLFPNCPELLIGYLASVTG